MYVYACHLDSIALTGTDRIIQPSFHSILLTQCFVTLQLFVVAVVILILWHLSCHRDDSNGAVFSCLSFTSQCKIVHIFTYKSCKDVETNMNFRQIDEGMHCTLLPESCGLRKYYWVQIKFDSTQNLCNS